MGDSIGRLVRGCRYVWGTRRYGTSQNYCLIPSGFKCSQSWFSGTPRQHNAHSRHTQVCMHTHTKRHINPQINNIVRFTITKRGYVSCHYTLVQCGCVDHSLPYKSLFFCCVTLTPNFYLYMKIMSVYKSEWKDDLELFNFKHQTVKLDVMWLLGDIRRHHNRVVSLGGKREPDSKLEMIHIKWLI